MESRKITVIHSNTQRTKVIMSEAETLAQLKADLTANDIDYTDMAFYEGVSKTEILSDESILPKDIPYKGNTTNELVFMLTMPNKKIKSGSDRAALYDFIKSNNLQEEVKECFGKNFTQVASAALEEFMNKHSIAPVEEHTEETPSDTLIERLCVTLEKKGYLTAKDLDYIMKGIKNENEIPSSYDQEELDEMFNF